MDVRQEDILNCPPANFKGYDVLYSADFAFTDKEKEPVMRKVVGIVVGSRVRFWVTNKKPKEVQKLMSSKACKFRFRKQVSLAMRSSGEGKTVYIFERVPTLILRKHPKSSVPSRILKRME